VDLIVTSPPYFGLRSYQDGGEHYEGQIGDEATPAEFVDALVAATAEMVRVLKPSGSIWVNLGDKYAGGGNGPAGSTGAVEGYGNRSRQPTAAEKRAAMGSTRPKSLIGVPWRYALRCIDDLGLILRAEVIWSKPNGLPESVTDRVRRSHETWFHFTKSPRYFSAVDEIREEHVATATGRDTSAWRTGPSGANRGTETGRRHDDGGRVADFATSPLGKLPGSVWTIPTQPLRVPDHLGIDHFAAFPMEWPRRIIRGWSPSGVCVDCGEGRRPVSERDPIDPRFLASNKRGDGRGNVEVRGVSQSSILRTGLQAGQSPATRIVGEKCACPEPIADTRPAVVLDPFGGTGTTALVAKALGRHGISNDMSSDYCRLATWRTNDDGELARAMQVEKPAEQVKGQASLLDLIDGGAA
jgi:DNA modification methylase